MPNLWPNSKVVSTHRTGTHPEQPLPTGYKGIPFIIGDRGIAWGVPWGCVAIFLDKFIQRAPPFFVWIYVIMLTH